MEEERRGKERGLEGKEGIEEKKAGKQRRRVDILMLSISNWTRSSCNQDS